MTAFGGTRSGMPTRGTPSLPREALCMYLTYPPTKPDMRIITAPDFSPERDDPNEPLFVHTRAGRSNGDLVVFVHGLGGSRYGTWQLMPRLLFKDCPEIDIGLYAYRTGMRRLQWWRS